MTLSYHLHLINETWKKCVSAWIIYAMMAFDISISARILSQFYRKTELKTLAPVISVFDIYGKWILIFRDVSSIALVYPHAKA